MSVAAKVMGKVLIRRIPDGVDAKLRKEQAGSRKERSTIEQIFVLSQEHRRASGGMELQLVCMFCRL